MFIFHKIHFYHHQTCAIGLATQTQHGRRSVVNLSRRFLTKKKYLVSAKMASRNRKVCVWGRFRPTANFAHENIELLSDGKASCIDGV